MTSRAPRPRGVKEYALQIDLADDLRDFGDPAWEWTADAAGEARDDRTAAKLKAMGVRRGHPDLRLDPPGLNANPVGVELKRPRLAKVGNEARLLSGAQKRVRDGYAARGWPYHVVADYAAGVALFVAIGILDRVPVLSAVERRVIRRKAYGEAVLAGVCRSMGQPMRSAEREAAAPSPSLERGLSRAGV